MEESLCVISGGDLWTLRFCKYEIHNNMKFVDIFNMLRIQVTICEHVSRAEHKTGIQKRSLHQVLFHHKRK